MGAPQSFVFEHVLTGSFCVFAVSNMTEPPVLKAWHDLLGRNILPLNTRIQNMNAPARLGPAKEAQAIGGICRGPVGARISGKRAGKDVSYDNAMLALHCAIELANEVGQPRGQQLQNPTQATGGQVTGKKWPAEEPPNQVRVRWGFMAMSSGLGRGKSGRRHVSIGAGLTAYSMNTKPALWLRGDELAAAGIRVIKHYHGG